MKRENICFFSLPAIITGLDFALTGLYCFWVSCVANRGEAKTPFSILAIFLAGLALVWVGWLGWKKAKKLNLLNLESEALFFDITALILQKNSLKFLLILGCLLFWGSWVFPGPVPLSKILTGGFLAWSTKKYLIAKAELRYAKQKWVTP